MTQYARPDSDVSAGNWTATPLYEKIDEVTADDAVTAILQNTDGGTCEIGLGNVTDPSGNSGHVIRVRAKYAANQPTFAFKLMDGATEIRSESITLNSDWTTHAFTLTTTEADNISDYTDLRFKFIAGSVGFVGCYITWAEFECPDASGAASVNLDAASATVTGQVVTIDAGASPIVVNLVHVTVASTGQVVTINVGSDPVTINADAALISSLGKVITIIGGDPPTSSIAVIQTIYSHRRRVN